MCDYSLHSVKSRSAKVADKLITKDFGMGTIGFCDVEAQDVAVCVLPGTELAFDGLIKSYGTVFDRQTSQIRDFVSNSTTAIFRQINKEIERTHHDCLEMPDGQVILLTLLEPGQTVTVLQLPAAPKTEAEADEQKRVEVVA